MRTRRNQNIRVFWGSLGFDFQPEQQFNTTRRIKDMTTIKFRIPKQRLGTELIQVVSDCFKIHRSKINTNKALTITCTAEQFGVFIVERNNRGCCNYFLELDAKIISSTSNFENVFDTTKQSLTN